MKIEIINVGDVQKKDKYSVVELVYKNIDKDKTETKKLMNFSYPLVYNALRQSSKGDKFDIKLAKEGEYWQWTECEVAGTESTPTPSSSGPEPKAYVKGSNYETSEERKERQTHIIRQSSLGHAVNTLKVDGEALEKDAVLALAADYEQWVTRKTMAQHLEGFPDDFPE
jgi:hypothetical protein